MRYQGMMYLLTFVALILTSNKLFSMHRFSDVVRRTDSAGDFELVKVRLFNETEENLEISVDGYLDEECQDEKTIPRKSTLILEMINRLSKGEKITTNDEAYPSVGSTRNLYVMSNRIVQVFPISIVPNLELYFVKQAEGLAIYKRKCPNWKLIEPIQSDSDS